MEPVLAALSAAHAAGIVHRDVKPENVLLADDGRVKVADFGLARAFSGPAGSATRTQGVILGTMAYLSPEQVEHGQADARSDVYAAGVMLYELLTGTLPFTGDSPINVAFRHVNEDVPPPSRLVPSIHPAVDALVERATRRKPEERPQDAGRLLAGGARGPGHGSRGRPRSRRRTLVDQQTIVLTPPRVSHPTTAEPAPSTPRKGPGAVGGRTTSRGPPGDAAAGGSSRSCCCCSSASVSGRVRRLVGDDRASGYALRRSSTSTATPRPPSSPRRTSRRRSLRTPSARPMPRARSRR